jgi:hypothetical protein
VDEVAEDPSKGRAIRLPQCPAFGRGDILEDM